MPLQFTAAAPEGVLMQKRLSQSDLSDQVLKSGRIVLPRVAMEYKAAEIIAIGCTDKRPSHPDEASATWNLEVVDSSGREWMLFLKKWTAAASVQPRPIFVLEKSTDCMRANGATPGDCMQLSISQDNRLLLTILSAKEAAGATHKTQSFSRCSVAALQMQTSGGCRCQRSDECLKIYGHAGFCTGQQSFRSTQPAFDTNFLAPGAGNNANTRPEWVRVRCGYVMGSLHVSSLKVTLPGATHNDPPQSISLAEFERVGGMAHCRKWRTSVMVVPNNPLDFPVTLGRWLERWPQDPIISSPPTNSPETTTTTGIAIGTANERSSTTAEDVAMAASKVLLSLSHGSYDTSYANSSQGGQGHDSIGDPPSRSHAFHHRFIAPQEEIETYDPVCSPGVHRPRPAKATPAEGLALYAKIAAPAPAPAPAVNHFIEVASVQRAIPISTGQAVHTVPHVYGEEPNRAALVNNLMMVLEMMRQ